MKNSIKKLPKKKKGTRKNNRRKKGGATDSPIMPTNNRNTKNSAKIRIQFLKSNEYSSPHSIISVTKGPTDGIFDYMWYNIDNIEDMLSTAMKGINMVPEPPSEIVYNVIPNDDKSNKTKNDETEIDDDDEMYNNKKKR
jgi:hypothetical protein